PFSVYARPRQRPAHKRHQKGKYVCGARKISLKITIFGLTISSSWGNGHATPYRAVLRALHRMGHRIVFYERNVPYYANRRDLVSSDFCQLVLYSTWEGIRDRALRDCSDSDVVINASYCPEGACIIDEVLDVPDPLHVFYDLDTPITLAGLAENGIEYLRADQIPQFDLYLSWCGGSILNELELCWGAQYARPLYGCVDPDVHRRVEVPEQYRCLMSYMGTYSADRQQKLDSLFLEPARRWSSDPFVLAGSLYPWEWTWPVNVRRFEHVSPQDHPALYSGSRFTLNLTREVMARVGFCPSGRFFEAAACGTPIISDWFNGLDHFFAPQKEIFIVRDTDEVLQALQSSDDEVARIASAARERTLSEHTGERRAVQLIQYLEDVFARRAKSIAEVA
ncbi:MAG TPA: glycosyltransferase, partial [Terriglobales bacterium]|nr:glycosyltransferase [Terriglobales bacterium]